MKKLEEIIKDQHDKSGLVRKGGDEILAKLRAPLANIIGNNNEDWIQKRIDDLKNRPKATTAKPSPINIVPKRQDSPVYRLRVTAPYDYRWAATGGGAQNNASADDENGSIGVAVDAVNENGYACAGVGTLRSPTREMFLYFRPQITYNYSWLDLANLASAHSGASFGIYIQVFDWTGFNVDNIDLRYPLWNDNAGWLEEHSDSCNGATVNHKLGISVSPGFHYIFWAWFSVSCWNGRDAFSEASLEAIVNAMLFYSSD
jgi:hypothetical protein